MLTLEEIQRVLPQTFPFLFIDRVESLETGKRIVCVKNVTQNERFFKGHFPDYPVLPGVILLEAMAQAAIILYAKTKYTRKERVRYFFARADIKFKAPIVPGDQVFIEVTLEKARESLCVANSQAIVNNSVAAEAALTLSIRKLPETE